MEKHDDLAATLPVREIIAEIPGVRTLRFDNSGGQVPLHRPGQHVKVGVETPSGVAWKGFSLSSSPSRPGSLDVTVRLKPEGTVSRALHALSPGDLVRIKGPSGRFFFDREAHPEPPVLIAAGIGITPLMSILRSIHDRPIDRPVTLFYGCRTADDRIFAGELERMRREIDGFRSVTRLSRSGGSSSGRIDPRFLADSGVEPPGGRYFLSLPGDGRRVIEDWLIAGGCSPDRIHSEVFGKGRGNAS